MSVRISYPLLLSLILSGAGIEGLRAQGVDQAGPARARLEGGVVIVRQFTVPSAPFPGLPPTNAPMMERAEHRLHFNARDIQVFHPDGKPVDAAAWQAVLAQEAAVLHLGHAFVDPNSGAPSRRESVSLAADERAVYKPDALVLFGSRSPVKHERVRDAKLLQGVLPHFGTAAVGQDGMIRVTVRRDLRSHFYAPTATGGNAHIFQNTTITTTRTLPYADVRVWTPDGKLIASATLPQWLTKDYSALISGDGGEVDPLYRELLKPNTPVIAVPTRPQPSPSQSPPAPTAPPPRPNAAPTSRGS